MNSNTALNTDDKTTTVIFPENIFLVYLAMIF
jgi:hypothetical protein